jgi:hypothetical protein
MKIIVTKYDSHYEIQVKDGCLPLHSYAFVSKGEVEAFCSGFSVAKTISNNLIQSLPMGYEVK